MLSRPKSRYRTFPPAGGPFLFLSHTHVPLASSLTLLDSGWPLSCSPFYNFVISGILYRWNQTICNLGDWLFSTWFNSLEINPRFACISRSFLFYCWVVSHGMDIPQCNLWPVGGLVGCLQLLAILNKAAIKVYRFFKKCTSLLWDRCPVEQLLVFMVVYKELSNCCPE